MTFDFVALLLVASILAGVGLIVNSTVVIVASMLVSPIMGPVMGITFGSRVLDWKLARESLGVEVGALVIAILTGAVVGLCGAFSFYAEDWPTPEMASRGDVSGLITGVAIAIPRYEWCNYVLNGLSGFVFGFILTLSCCVSVVWGLPCPSWATTLLLWSELLFLLPCFLLL